MPLPPRTYDTSLNSELERLQYQIEVIRQEAEGLLWGLSDEQFNWSPGGGAWSMAQCMDHLNVTNARMIEQMEASIEGGRQAGLRSDGPFVYSLLGRWFRKIVEPPPKFKAKAPQVFKPAPRRSMEETQAAWKKTHDRLEELILAANGLDLAKIKVRSAALPMLKFELGMAFWIQTAHDRRHLWQMRQIRNHPGFPAGC